jgi:hypothetical protein
VADEDVVMLLQAQHARIEQLFREVLQSERESRQQRFDELVRLLAMHETAEEEVVHPRGRAIPDVADPVIDARLAEERAAKQQLADLVELGTDHPEFTTRLLALRDAVLMHAKREERYEFPYLQQSLDAKSRGRLARAVLAAERLAPTRPHPGIESATGNLLAGPALAVADRVRDEIRKAMADR